MLNIKTALVASATVFLVACGGGNSSSQATTDNEQATNNPSDSSAQNDNVSSGKYDLYEYDYEPKVLENNKVAYNVTEFYSNDVLGNDSHLTTYEISYKDETIDNRIINVQSNYEVTQDTYQAMIEKKEYTNYNTEDISDDKIITTLIKNSSVQSVTIDKRKASIGEKISISSKTNGVENTVSCSLNKHYDSINTKEVVDSFYNGKYNMDVDKTYNDILELKCIDSSDTTYLSYIYLAKDIGPVVSVYSGLNSTSDLYWYLTEQKFFDRY